MLKVISGQSLSDNGTFSKSSLFWTQMAWYVGIIEVQWVELIWTDNGLILIVITTLLLTLPEKW